MKQYAVIHIEKGKGSGGALGHHIDRTEGKEYSYKHSDPDKKHLNHNFTSINKYAKMPLQMAISERIKDGYTSKRKINDNAVTHLKIVLTGSHEQMKKMENNPEEFKKWVYENQAFLERQYGAENIVRFALHRDEKTPHLHAVIVPLTEDGRLSAFEVIGNKTKLKKLQDDYHKSMMQFGLERGEKNTGITHEDAKAYYARMGIANEIAEKTEIKVSKNLLGGYKSESVEELKESVKSLKSALKAKESILASEKKNKESIIKTLESYTEDNKNLKNKLENVIIDDKLRDLEEDRRYQNLKKKVTQEFSTELNRTPAKELRTLNSFDKIYQYIEKKLLNILSNKLSHYAKKLTEDRSFAMNIFEKVEQKAKSAIELGEKQEVSRNRGMRR